ncbi:hypothetical protein [Mycobacterium servetii]|uniref:Uncharacterized protein n=1 Tax=Mycobacterium servetii TaxID=3237418 RepID=A0ABV4C1D8_9MYCO
MYVTDLQHFLDMPPDAPGPARRLAEHLSAIVRAATAGDARIAWESALPCRRRPANRRCPGRLIVHRGEPGSPIDWRCSACGDDGVISSWEESHFDLRRRRPALVGTLHQIVVPHEVAAALRELCLLETELERLVFGIRVHGGDAILTVTDEQLDDLIDAMAAEANHETNRRRRQRLDAAYDALDAAAGSADRR